MIDHQDFDDHQDPLVITTKIGTNTVKKILIDTGMRSTSYTMMLSLEWKLGDRKLVNLNLPLFGFTGNEVKVAGVINLPYSLRDSPVPKMACRQIPRRQRDLELQRHHWSNHIGGYSCSRVDSLPKDEIYNRLQSRGSYG